MKSFNLKLTTGIKVIFFLSIISIIIICPGYCAELNIGKLLNDTIEADGVITYIDLEGGFYGIITGSGDDYLPNNLPVQYKKNGTNVHFQGIINDDGVSFMQWGTPVTITKIKPKIQVIPTIELYNKGKKVILSSSQKSMLIPLINSALSAVDTVYRCITPVTEVEQKKKTERIMLVSYGKPVDLSTSLGSGEGESINNRGSSVIQKVRRVAFLIPENESLVPTADILIMQDKKTYYGCYSEGRYQNETNSTNWIEDIELIISQSNTK